MTTYATVLAEAAQRYPERVFVHAVTEGGATARITYGELATRTDAVSRALLASGLRPGDRVAVALPNQAEWLDLMLGAARVGIITVTLNVRYREHELRHMITPTRACSDPRRQNAHVGTGPDDVVVGVMPLNHVGGLTVTVTAALLSGATVVLLPAFSPAGALDALEQHQATLFAGVPTMWKLMLDHESAAGRDLTHLRNVIIGGSNADPALCRQIAAALPGARLMNLYGLSEVSGAAVISAAHDDLDLVSSSIGVAIPGVEARIAVVDENAGGGRRAPAARAWRGGGLLGHAGGVRADLRRWLGGHGGHRDD